MVASKSQPSTCIYCEQPAGSREHLFLASCGGLKKDTSILCSTCNGIFGGTLDTALLNALSEFNGLLGVQDRDHDKKPAIFHDPTTGDPYEVDRYGVARLAQPVIRKRETEDNIDWIQLSAGTHKQLDDWIKAQEKLGRKVITRTKRNVTHTSGPPQLSKQGSFSTRETLRASARLSLNFLAHCYPHIARMSELLPLKQYIRSPDSPEHTFYTLVEPRNYFGDNSFRFGHRVIIVYDSKRSHLYAFVDYFSALTVLVDMGTVVLGENFIKIVDIDPLAEREPNDIRQRDDIQERAPLIPYEPIAESDSSQFYDGIEERFRNLVRDIHEFQEEQVCISVLRFFNKKNSKEVKEEELYRCLVCADALIFDSLQRKMLLICDHIETLESSHSGYKTVADVLRQMVGKPKRDGEIHPSMVASVEACRRKSARLIINNITNNHPVTLTFLKGLLSDQGVVGHFSATLIDRIVHGTLGQRGYDALAKKLSDEK